LQELDLVASLCRYDSTGECSDHLKEVKSMSFIHSAKSILCCLFPLWGWGTSASYKQ